MFCQTYMFCGTYVLFSTYLFYTSLKVKLPCGQKILVNCQEYNFLLQKFSRIRIYVKFLAWFVLVQCAISIVFYVSRNPRNLWAGKHIDFKEVIWQWYLNHQIVGNYWACLFPAKIVNICKYKNSFTGKLKVASGQSFEAYG